jgi:transposase
MDTSKHFFQLHGVNAAGTVVLRKKLRRKEMVAFFKALAAAVIGIKACGASHHWARILRPFGHAVKLIAAQLVKPYGKRGENDTAGAEALCEAMSRPAMRFVPVKTAGQQAALMMAGLRDRLIRNRTQLANAVRGFTAARRMAHIDPLPIAFKLMRACPSWLASCSRPKLKNMRSCRRKSPKSTPSSWPGKRPMNAAGASPISPASVRSARLCC